MPVLNRVATPAAAVALAAALAAASPAAAQDLGSCQFLVPSDTFVAGYGVYTGSLHSEVKLRGDGHRVQRVQIHVPKKPQPILLVFSAYDPVEWELDIEPGAKLIGVMALGMHSQTVSRLPERTPIGFSTVKDGQGRGCPAPLYVYAQNEAGSLSYAAKTTFGRPLTDFRGSYGAKCLAPNCVVKTSAAPSYLQTLFGGGSAPRLTNTGIIRTSGRLIEK